MKMMLLMKLLPYVLFVRHLSGSLSHKTEDIIYPKYITQNLKVLYRKSYRRLAYRQKKTYVYAGYMSISVKQPIMQFVSSVAEKRQKMNHN